MGRSIWTKRVARLPRLDIPGVPQHIVQRGNDRLPCFAADDDYVRYCQELREAAFRHGCAVHAYVLMTNHVHLLVTPQAPGAASRMMQMLGRRYVGCFNARYGRSGTLWEGRFKSCLVDTDAYLLRCYRYIELNPVRARMVAAPGDYRWSSYRHNAYGVADPLVTPHAGFVALGTETQSRQSAYAALVAEIIPMDEIAEIRNYLDQGRAWGSGQFQAHVEALLGRAVRLQGRGRPSHSERK